MKWNTTKPSKHLENLNKILSISSLLQSPKPWPSVDSGSVVGLVGLDISAAFDTVSHERLLERLKSEFGSDSAPLGRIESYLKSRSFSVQLGRSRHGSVLGPVLFTAYVSPIRRLIDSRRVKYHCYADDTQLYTALTLPSLSGIAHLEHCSKDLQYLFWQNNFLLNPNKSEVIYLGTRQRLCDLPSKLCVAECDITSSDTVKILLIVHWASRHMLTI